MKIKADFDLKEKTIEDFCRILLKDIGDFDLEVKTLKKEGYIKLLLKSGNLEAEMSYKDISHKIKNQKIVMLKCGLLKLHNKKYLWGGITGVRPTKLVRKFIKLGISLEEIRDILKEIYLLSEEKIDLLLKIVKTELKYLNRDFINIYIGIPFCPTKCTYCSFASYERDKYPKKYYQKFLESLKKEIELSGKFLKEERINIESIYIGGGTPSILSEEELENLLKQIKENFDLNYLKEFTLEAGRIDTITAKKLELSKKYGVDRISINPQSFNAESLKSLNRYFDLEKFNEVYKEAKKYDFIINMDMIVGLPNETKEDIINSLEKLRAYEIENLTIHMLALKKKSNLYKNKHNLELKEEDFIQIQNKIKEITKEKGMFPYYMYRQKNSIDMGENIGYSKLGKESRFNIEMIEENQNTFALGGGGISKIIKINEECYEDIKRYINPKDPSTYVNQLDERLKMKLEAFTKN